MSTDRETIDELESALKSLRPRSLESSRNRIMYRAGRASMRRLSWATGVFTTLLGLAAGIGATFAALRVYPGQPEKVIVHVIERGPSQPAESKKPKTVPQDSPLPDGPIEVTQKMPSGMVNPMTSFLGYSGGQMNPANNYLGLRNQVLRFGVDILPSSRGGSGPVGDAEPWSVLDAHGKKKQEPLEF